MRRVVDEKKQTIIMVTHDDYLTKYADRIFKIVDGKIVEEIENK